MADQVRGVVEPKMMMRVARLQIFSYLGKLVAGVGHSRYRQSGSHPVDTSNSSRLLLLTLWTSLAQSE